MQHYQTATKGDRKSIVVMNVEKCTQVIERFIRQRNNLKSSD